MKKTTKEKSLLIRSAFIPFAFLLGLWLIKLIEVFFGISLVNYGLYPLDVKGLRGILFAPLIHGGWEHLMNNSIPAFVLSWGLFYFYRAIFSRVFLLVYFLHGFWLWFFGRHAYHIGASGIVYGLGAFLFVSGLIRRNTHLLAISLLVAFLYGSMVWGIFPLEETVSWEAHLTGTLAGIFLAFFYKDYGPPANFGQWKEQPHDEDEPDDEYDYWNRSEEWDDKEMEQIN